MATRGKPMRHQGQEGQAIVLIALATIGLLAFMVLAIDGSRYYDQRRTSQNASDAASLAGLYWYKHNTPNLNQNVLVAINNAAEKNGIQDTNGTPGDAINTNVKAWWININGLCVDSGGTTYADPSTCAATGSCQLDNSTSAKPANASGILVGTYIPYTTFVGQLIGKKTLQAQADGTALVFPGTGTSPLPGGRDAVWTGGGNCDTATNPALYWGGKSANNTDWGNGVTVNGWITVDNVPNRFDANGGSGNVVAVAGPNTALDSGGTTFTAKLSPFVWKGPTSTEATSLYN